MSSNRKIDNLYHNLLLWHIHTVEFCEAIKKRITDMHNNMDESHRNYVQQIEGSYLYITEGQTNLIDGDRNQNDGYLW